MTADPAKDAERLVAEIERYFNDLHFYAGSVVDAYKIKAWLHDTCQLLKDCNATIARLTQERDGWRESSTQWKDQYFQAHNEARRSAEALQSACSSAVERSAHNGNVAGSTPAARTTQPSAADVERARITDVTHLSDVERAQTLVGKIGFEARADRDFDKAVEITLAALTAARREERERQIARVAKLRQRDDDAPPRNLVEEITAAFPIEDWTDILASALKVTDPNAKNSIGRVIAAAHAALSANEIAVVRREERELRALDEAAIEAARAYCDSRNSLGRLDSSLLHAMERALAARDAAIRARTGEE